MKTNLLISVACGVLLFGCGGGGDSGSSGGGSSSVPAASISSTNAQNLVGLVFSNSSSGKGYATMGQAYGLGAVKAGSVQLNHVKISQAIVSRAMEKMSSVPQSLAAGAVTSNTVQCTNGGSATVSSDTTGSGSVSFSSCNESGIVMSGTIAISATATTVNVTLTNVTMDFVSGTTTFTTTLAGTINVAKNGTKDSISMNYKATINNGTTSFFVEMKNFNYSFDSASLQETYSGTINDSINGSITISTPTPLTYANAADLYPSSGVIVISGAGGTAAKVTVQSSTTVLIQVNNGSGVYDAGTMVPWSAL